MGGSVLESKPATVQWRWHYNVPSLLLAAAVVLIPLVVPGGNREQLRMLLVVAACGILLVVDGLGVLFMVSLAASIAVGLVADRRRRRRGADEPQHASPQSAAEGGD